ncbi:VanW family protein [Paenisporosarcina sp. TG20]|uniref:VanW family protein n=1 Tax=Paenisporosarcina sp. TG20 TaxID=1211706 RepID=UPI0003011036|nr:VanW family protein [Paenisporosarcina sp. TG20]
MNNKLFGTTFAALLGTSVLFFGLSQAGTYVIDEVVFPTKGFGDQTYIGPYDVSNLAEQDAAVTVQTGVQGWYDQALVQIRLQDAIIPFPLEAIEFNTDATLTTAQNGSKNELQFDVSDESVGTFLHQQFSPMSFNDEQITSVTELIREHLATGRKEQTVDISNALYASSSALEMITNVSFNNIETTAGIQNLMFALDGYVINPLTTFSLLEFIESVDIGLVTEQDLTTLASILYASVLQTNFGVDERSIGPTVPTSVPLGFDASINRKLGVDFVFTNPNTTSFTININGVGSNLTASLSGLPFVYSYETTISKPENFSFKTIKQYSSFVEQKTIRIKTEGEDGVQVVVLKNILSGESILETREVSEDFYPPVHKVEVHPLTVTEAAERGTGSTDGTGTSTDGTTGQPSTEDGEGTDGSEDGTGSESGSNDDEDNTEEEPQYDKGGNLIPSSKE